MKTWVCSIPWWKIVVWPIIYIRNQMRLLSIEHKRGKRVIWRRWDITAILQLTRRTMALRKIYFGFSEAKPLAELISLTVIPLSNMKTLTSNFQELQLQMNSSSSNTNILSSSLLLRRHLPVFSSPSYLRRRTRNSKLVRLSSSLTHVSWLSPHHCDSKDYNGWTIVESPPHKNNKKKGIVCTH